MSRIFYSFFAFCDFVTEKGQKILYNKITKEATKVAKERK